MEQKEKLIYLADANGGVTFSIAKKVRRPVGECHVMYKQLKEYKVLGELKTVKENGIKITICPPAYARGVGPAKNAPGRS